MIGALLVAAAALGADMADPRTIEYVRPPLTSYQLSAFFHKDRYGWCEASTKSGKTHGGAAWITEGALLDGAPGRKFWWVAPVYKQAEIGFERLGRAIPKAYRHLNYSKLSIELANEAEIAFKSGENPDNLYGEDVYRAVYDEASRGRPESWHALRSTLTKTRGPVRLIGNVKGRKNWFYHGCRKAEADVDHKTGHRYAKITALDAVKAGILDAAEVEDARLTLPENVFRELYLAEPSEDGGNPFGIPAIRACVGPLSLAPVVAYGVDLAKSVDWTVVLGLDANGRVARFERFQSPWMETIDRVRAVVGTVPAYVDSTGVGDPVLEALQRRGAAGWARNFEGYKFSAESKQKLMEGLAVVIQRREVAYPAGVIVHELESFEYEYTRTGVRYEGADGMHDDAVCALALAAAKLRGNLNAQQWRPI